MWKRVLKRGHLWHVPLENKNDRFKSHHLLSKSYSESQKIISNLLMDVKKVKFFICWGCEEKEGSYITITTYIYRYDTDMNIMPIIWWSKLRWTDLIFQHLIDFPLFDQPSFMFPVHPRLLHLRCCSLQCCRCCSASVKWLHLNWGNRI